MGIDRGTQTTDSGGKETDMEERTQAQIWEQSEDTVVRDAWQYVWETIRAERIGGNSAEWAQSEDAWLLAADFADEILRVDESEDIAGTDEWNAVVDKCLAEIARLA